MLRKHRQLRRQVHQVMDASLFAIGLWIAHLIRSQWAWDSAPAIKPFEDFAWLYLFLIPLAPILLEANGFYDRPLLSSRRQTAWLLFKSCMWAVLATILVIFFFRKQHLIARSVIISFGFISFLLVYLKEELVRLGYKSNLGQLQAKKRLILVGTKEDTARLREEMDGQDGVETVMELDLNEISIEQLLHHIHDLSVNGVVINAQHTYFGQVEKAIQACELEGVEAWLVADFFKTQISRTTLDDFCGRPVLVFRTGPDAAWQSLVKQMVDFVGALFLLLFFSPVMIVAAIWIRLSSPGPVLFKQQRSGLSGKPFMMYKFRSMVTNAEQRKHELAAMNEMSGPVFKVTNDPRITPVGKWLRKFSVDEFPQLFNVLRGEMSLVGPRPLPVDEVKRFDDFAHRRRLSVKPGLTCLWQISGRNQINDFKDWVRLDLEYIDNWSLWLDLKILLYTVPVVLLAKGAK